MIDRRDSARDCWILLCRMCSGKEACSPAHPIRRAMRKLQKRYNGVFPEALRDLWDNVQLSTQPHATIEYHDGVSRLKDWVGDHFSFKEEELNNDRRSESDISNSMSADQWFDGDDRRN